VDSGQGSKNAQKPAFSWGVAKRDTAELGGFSGLFGSQTYGHSVLEREIVGLHRDREDLVSRTTQQDSNDQVENIANCLPTLEGDRRCTLREGFNKTEISSIQAMGTNSSLYHPIPLGLCPYLERNFSPDLEEIGQGLQIISHTIMTDATNFGVWLNVPNPGEFVTYLVVSFVTFLGSAFVAWISRREPRIMEPKLGFGLYSSIIVTKDDIESFRINVSNEHGETSAIACEVTLTMDDIEKRDVLHSCGARFSPDNFSTTVETLLPWDNGRTQTTLRAGRSAQIELLRLVPAKGDVEAHFEIPSSDPKFTSTICLKLKTFYPRVVASPLNGRHSPRGFKTVWDRQMKKWDLI
jgi:hypothetical protein